ncbi:AAA family ATPase [Gottfriedia luciferensis]|uniref:AAA family ATPase n=1 Tax=Gottfriedia luciferensis TaxID=178774 RepID=UPI000B43B11B|nr:AAA family ATPase [Gottfriedia luciferensis]
MSNQKSVYIVSGPAGVGKSTTSNELVKQFKNSAYISGDYVSHMHINGREKPWKSEKENELIWNNILSLTRNFLLYGNNVVIDFVTFQNEAEWLNDNLTDLDCTIFYIVLWANDHIVIDRDSLRKPENRMGERCLTLMEEFKDSGLNERHLLDTSHYSSDEMMSIINLIMNNENYKLISKTKTK